MIKLFIIPVFLGIGLATLVLFIQEKITKHKEGLDQFGIQPVGLKKIFIQWLIHLAIDTFYFILFILFILVVISTITFVVMLYKMSPEALSRISTIDKLKIGGLLGYIIPIILIPGWIIHIIWLRHRYEEKLQISETNKEG